MRGSPMPSMTIAAPNCGPRLAPRPPASRGGCRCLPRPCWRPARCQRAGGTHWAQVAGQPEQSPDAGRVVAQARAIDAPLRFGMAHSQVCAGGENRVGVGADQQRRLAARAADASIDVVQRVDLNLRIAAAAQPGPHPACVCARFRPRWGQGFAESGCRGQEVPAAGLQNRRPFLCSLASRAAWRQNAKKLRPMGRSLRSWFHPSCLPVAELDRQATCGAGNGGQPERETQAAWALFLRSLAGGLRPGLLQRLPAKAIALCQKRVPARRCPAQRFVI